jgi:hypothetical protein
MVTHACHSGTGEDCAGFRGSLALCKGKAIAKGILMDEHVNRDDADQNVPQNDGPAGPSLARRRALMLGAAGVAAAVTVRPAFAQTAASVFNCSIPVPDPVNGGKYIALDGTLVPAGTRGAFPGFHRPFKGEEVRQALAGRSLPGTTAEQRMAYLNYIRRLRAGQSGFTCYASIQMPR